MIYIICLILIVVDGLLAWALWRHKKDIEVLDAYTTELFTRCNRLSDNVATMAGKVAKYLDEFDDLNKKMEVLKEAVEDREYEELKDYLDKKWDEAVSDITSYDPFKVGDNR